MRKQMFILPGLLLGISLIFFTKVYMTLEQLLLRWRFASLMLITALVIVTLAIFLLKKTALQTALFNHRLQTGLLIGSMALAVCALILPARPVDYVNLNAAPQGVSETAPQIIIRPGDVVSLPNGELTLLDWLKRFSSKDVEQYQGKEIDVTGFVGYSNRSPVGQFSVDRLTLTCCIPDPVPVGMGVAWQTADRIPENTWVRVRGTIQLVKVNNDIYPEILANQVDIIPKPDQPYLFPQ